MMKNVPYQMLTDNTALARAADGLGTVFAFSISLLNSPFSFRAFF
jgi:hypothetical protein